MACGDNHTVVLLETGDIYTFGKHQGGCVLLCCPFSSLLSLRRDSLVDCLFDPEDASPAQAVSTDKEDVTN